MAVWYIWGTEKNRSIRTRITAKRTKEAYLEGLQFVQQLAQQTRRPSQTTPAYKTSEQGTRSSRTNASQPDVFSENYMEGLRFAQAEMNRVNSFFQTYDPFGQWVGGKPTGAVPENIFDKNFMDGLLFAKEQSARFEDMFQSTNFPEDIDKEDGYESDLNDQSGDFNNVTNATISLQIKGREGKAPKLDLTLLSAYQDDPELLTPRSRAAVFEYRDTLQFNADQLELNSY